MVQRAVVSNISKYCSLTHASISLVIPKRSCKTTGIGTYTIQGTSYVLAGNVVIISVAENGMLARISHQMNESSLDP